MTCSVLIITDGLFHPNLLARRAFLRVLSAVPGVQLTLAASMEDLTHLPLEQYCGLVLYFHHKRISDTALRAFEQYLLAGGGVLAVHSASASFKQTPRYFEILGGRFVRHGPVKAFQVSPATSPDATFGGVQSFTLVDELYRHEWDTANRVHFQIEVKENGKVFQEPFAWTRNHGKGRVAYVAAGHVAGTFRHPAVQQILTNALIWITGER